MSQHTKPDLSFSDALIRWYKQEARTLPWHNTSNPYTIWISEMMLQQTQVKSVLNYFIRFIKRYPDVYHLADSPIEEVLSYWSGLGYYRRAHYIHQTAIKIVQEYQGQFPNSYNTLIQLPGIGRYTAGAILSIAFNQAYPILDGNVKRVLSRYIGIADSLKQQSTENQLWKIAQDFIPVNQAGIFNSSMMELGALICKPKANQCACDMCPVQSKCFSYRNSKINVIPYLPKNPKKEYIEIHLFLAEYKGNILMIQSENSVIVPCMWELPNQLIQKAQYSKTIKHNTIQSCKDVSLAHLININTQNIEFHPIQWSYIAKTKHSITYKTMECLLYKAQLTKQQKAQYNNLIISQSYCWVKLNHALDLPHSSLMKKMLRLYNQHQQQLLLK